MPARQALISLMIKRQVLEEVGWFHWSRTSADDEYFERIRHVYGRRAHANVAESLYIASYRGDSLSRTGEGAIDPGEAGAPALSASRQAYVDSYRRWYGDLDRRGLRPFVPRLSCPTLCREGAARRQGA